MASTCPECATEWPQDPTFCGHCGALLGTLALHGLVDHRRPPRRPPEWLRPAAVAVAGVLLVATGVVLREDTAATVEAPGVDIASEHARPAADLVDVTGNPVCLGTTIREDCLVWEFPVAGLHDVHRVGDDVYGITAGHVLSLDLDGTQRFRVPLGPNPKVLSADQGGLVLATDEGVVHVGREGTIGWRRPGQQPVSGQAVHDGILVTRDVTSGQLQGLDVQTGEPRWHADAPHGITTMAVDGVVVGGATTHDTLDLSVVDHATGQAVGTVTLEETTSLRRVPAATQDVVVVVAVRDRAAHAIGVDPVLGEPVWSRHLVDLDVVPVDGRLVLSTADHGPVLVDPATGRVVATPPGGLPMDVPGAARPWEAIAAGHTDDGPLVVLRAPVTAPVVRIVMWRPDTNVLGRFAVSRPAGARVADDHVVVWGGEDIQVRELDGERRWSIPLPFAVPASTSPLVVAVPTGVLRLDVPPDQ